MLPGVPLDWCKQMKHCFLIRDPKYEVNSYQKKRTSISGADIGVRRQWELFDEITQLTGHDIAVIDSSEFLARPEAHLRALCSEWHLPFDESMLSWPKGIRESDCV